jgi:hypothetical protein
MEIATAGELVRLMGDGPQLDGIVFDVPSRSKVVVAVVDPARGPMFRTVHPRTLAERTDAAPGDRALQMLIRRTPAPVRNAAGGRSVLGRDQAAHTRSTMHRTTGK